MKKLLLVILLIFVTVSIFSFHIGGFVANEIGGYERFYTGLRFGSFGLPLGFTFETYVIESIYSDKFLDLNNIFFSPYLYLSLPVQSLVFYGGAGPTFRFNIDNGDFHYFERTLSLKAGVQFGRRFIVFLETSTGMNYDFDFSGVFSIHLGFGLGS